MSKVNEILQNIKLTDSKQQLQNAIRQAREAASEYSASAIDPKAKVKFLQEQLVQSASEEFLKPDFLGAFQTALIQSFRQLTDKVDVLQHLQGAINLKRQQLEELTGLETEYINFATLVDAKVTKIRELSEDIGKLDEYRNDKTNELHLEFDRKHNELTKEFELKERTLKSDFNYNKLILERDLADERKRIEAEWNELRTHQTEIEDMRIKIESIPHMLENERQNTRNTTINEIQGKMKSLHEVDLAKRDSIIEQYRAEIQLLRKDIEVKNNELEKAGNRVEAAMARIEKVAVTASQKNDSEAIQGVLNQVLAQMSNTGRK